MRPVPIPDSLIFPDFKLKTIGAPRGEETSIGAIEAQVGMTYHGPTFVILCRVDEKDLENLKNNQGLFWYTQFTDHLHPFSFTPLQVDETQGIDTSTLQVELGITDPDNPTLHTPENLAQKFYDTHEQLVSQAKGPIYPILPWEEVPEQNKQLIIATIKELFFK